MSELTTIKIPVQVRDRLAATAELEGITVRALLDRLSRHAADTALMEQVAAQMHRLQTSQPEAWQDYVTEGDQWERTTTEPLDA